MLKIGGGGGIQKHWYNVVGMADFSGLFRKQQTNIFVWMALWGLALTNQTNYNKKKLHRIIIEFNNTWSISL